MKIQHRIWALLPENLILLHVNNNVADQPVLSVFVPGYLECIVSKLSTCITLVFMLVPVAGLQVALSLTLWQAPKTGFLATRTYHASRNE